MIVNEHATCSVPLPELRRFLAQARRATGLRGTVAVRLTSDDGIRQLNRLFRGHDAPTDVLSFPAAADQPRPPRARLHAGDLAVSLDTAARQARRRRHSLALEVRVLLLHGLLHLAGFDHETDRGEMRARERQLRRQLRLPAGLIERRIS